MRIGYLVMGVGLALVKWPIVIGYDRNVPLYEGVVAVLLTAMSLLAFLGLRYPVRLLPILLFETLLKVIWLSVVALPAMLADEVDPAMGKIILSFAPEVIIVAVTPGATSGSGTSWPRAIAGTGGLPDPLRPLAPPVTCPRGPTEAVAARHPSPSASTAPQPGARAPDRHRDHSLPFSRSRSNAGRSEQVLETLGVAMNAIAHEVLDPPDVLQSVETDLLKNGSGSVRPRVLHDAVGQPRTCHPPRRRLPRGAR
jgi:hypothetical protein